MILVTHEADIAKHAWRQVQLRDGSVLSDLAMRTAAVEA